VPFVGVPPLNADFSRDAIIAYVNGEPYTMTQLETAVRVAKALAVISKDTVPEYGAPEMRAFQINMLRRELDGVLARQALRREGLQAPGGDASSAVQAFLSQFSATQEQLDAALAANGLTRAQLDQWFAEGRDTQFYIQTKLMSGQSPESRPAVVKAWLDQQWAEQDIQIRFYDPDVALPAASPSPSP
jgi:hypothetical protein